MTPLLYNAPVNVDSLLQLVLGRQGKYFGMAAVILRGEQIIAQGVAGVRKRGSAEPITIEDRFHLGSCGKAMTATLAATLVEEGRLNWDATLGDLFGGTVKDMHPVTEKVTLRQLLAHRAGFHLLAGRTLRARLLSAKDSLSLPQQRLEIARYALSSAPKHTPGTKFRYSNVGYVIAAAALEKVTGRAWEDLMRERLFQPLGITTGGFGAPGTAGQVDQPWGHSWFIGKPLDPGSPAAELPLFYAPAGLAHMAIGNWAKFIALHLRGDPANPNRQSALLKPDTFAEMHPVTPARTYSAGWIINRASWAKGGRPGDAGRILWHAGSNGRWNSLVGLAPEIDFAVLVACNRGPDIALWKTIRAGKALMRAFVSVK